MRLKISRVDGDADGDGDLDRLYSFGGRSFAIRNPQNQILFDSGDDFERITAEATRQTYGRLVAGRPYFAFNAADDESSFDETSDLRGPEPISVATGRVGGHVYAFIGLERVGGIMTYEISRPAGGVQALHQQPQLCARPEVGLHQAAIPSSATVRASATFRPRICCSCRLQDSPVDQPLLIVSNATSGSATVFALDGGG